jgi:DNA invertase Pin-like site-specific DNA recombinase
MTKITADHLARGAIVYVRQSTPDQLVHNQESLRRQYGLAGRAKELGWATVEVVDDDLGRSGGGVTRPGFERLLAAICEGRVGAVFAIEVSRLARNGRDWHTLIEFCGLVGTVIIDEDGVYDARHSNDRLLLGMKGTMSELELSLFRQRSHEALKQKARRGALFLGVAVGYVKSGRDRIEKDPDQQVQAAVGIVFAKFAELQSVRQVHLWLREEGIALPAARHDAAEGRIVGWRLPLYSAVHAILTNPVYAGAYAFGRTTNKVSVEEGRKRVKRGMRRPLAEWEVLLKDQHEGYISWTEFERNQRAIADNATGKGGAVARGAARQGELLLAGLLRWIEGEIAAVDARKPAPLGEREREQLMRLGLDLELAWSHPAATSATRKRILRAALNEIVVRVEAEHIEMVLHWQGGDHTAIKLKKNGVGKHRWTIPEDTLSLVRELARLMPDRQIARLLNRAGKPTGRGNGWTQARARSFRSHYGIAVHRPDEWAERGEITLEAAAQIMDVSVMTALRMVRQGVVKGRQICRGAPWAIEAEDVAAYRARKESQRPLTADSTQGCFDFQ